MSKFCHIKINIYPNMLGSSQKGKGSRNHNRSTTGQGLGNIHMYSIHTCTFVVRNSLLR